MRRPREQAALSKELREAGPVIQQLKPFGPEFDAQHPQDGSQLSVNSSGRSSDAFSILPWHQECTWCAYYMQAEHSHISNNSNIILKLKDIATLNFIE